MLAREHPCNRQSSWGVAQKASIGDGPLALPRAESHLSSLGTPQRTLPNPPRPGNTCHSETKDQSVVGYQTKTTRDRKRTYGCEIAVGSVEGSTPENSAIAVADRQADSRPALVSKASGCNFSSGDHWCGISLEFEPSDRRHSAEIVLWSLQPGGDGVRRHHDTIKDGQNPRQIGIDSTCFIELEIRVNRLTAVRWQGQQLVLLYQPMECPHRNTEPLLHLRAREKWAKKLSPCSLVFRPAVPQLLWWSR